MHTIGHAWHWHPWVDWDPGQSSPFKADWDSVGQCEMDLHGIGIPGVGQLESWDRHPSRHTNPWMGYTWHWRP